MFKATKGKAALLFSLVMMATGVNVAFAQTKGKQNTVFSSKEMVFTNAKWRYIVAKAKKDNKYIFVDAFTTWCEPCRQLKNVTFKDKNVTAYFNDNFINYTIDMEKGEGIELGEKWGVTGYPTLLFFTPEGKMIMRQIGYINGKQLVEIGKQALARK